MAARNPGPVLNPAPVGFPSFNKRVQRDWLARSAFREHEVNGRVYEAVYANLGFKGPVPIKHKVRGASLSIRVFSCGPPCALLKRLCALDSGGNRADPHALYGWRIFSWSFPVLPPGKNGLFASGKRRMAAPFWL